MLLDSVFPHAMASATQHPALASFTRRRTQSPIPRSVAGRWTTVKRREAPNPVRASRATACVTARTAGQ